MPSKLKHASFAGLTRFGGSTVGRRVAGVVESLDRAFENDNSDHETNGECWLLSRIADQRPSVVFDVGANRGTWTLAAVERMQSATVYAFEPIVETFEALRSAVRSESRVQVSNVALTSQGRETLNMWRGQHDTLSTAVETPTDGSSPVEVVSISGDEFCRREGVDHIDLLKVDTEGHDLAVLEGFDRMFAGGHVDVVQFEFTLFAVYARTWLRDFYDYLTPFGFRVGKLYPTWIRWRTYDAHDERFLRCNFVAVRTGASVADSLGVTGSGPA